MINLQDLQFSYAQGGFTLRVDRLSVSEGQRVCWVGPSGSGKTTLLHVAAGIIMPDMGRVEACGVDLTALGESARRDFRIANIGLVFQDFALLDYLNVLDNVLLPYRINDSLKLDGAVRDRARNLVTEVGLESKLSRLPTQLSQGERQRVAVCRALITSPRLLLVDEPTANLDPQNAVRVLDILDGYVEEQGATMVIVSHDREVIAAFPETTDISSLCSTTPVVSVEGSDGV